MRFFQAQHEKVAILNYDGAHAMPRVLGIPAPPINTLTETGIENIRLSLLACPYVRFVNKINRGSSDERETYLKQFKDDFGYLAYADLVSTFTGAPCDLLQIGKFCALVEQSHYIQEQGMTHAIIDVEATAALQSMLNSSEDLINRIRWTFQRHRALITMASMAFPLVGDFLKTEYIQNFDTYTRRLEEAASALKAADYFLVCIPEETPVNEMFKVGEIVRSFGGNIAGYIINNIRGENGEQEQIDLVRSTIGSARLLLINHYGRATHGSDRQEAIRAISHVFE